MLFSQSVKISAHIAQLLRDYDCVIIPGLGGFVANYSPSQYHLAKGIFMPPNKAIIFNKNLINNDGLLVNHIAHQEKISYADASHRLQDFANWCKNEFLIGNRIEFEELGVLYEDAEKTIQFRPDFSINFLTSSFGLYPVVAKELVQSISTPEPVVETVKIIPTVEEKVEPIERKIEHKIRVVETQNTEEKKVVEIRKRRTGRNIAIAAVLLPIAFYSIWIPLKTDVLKTGVIEVADLNPFHRSVDIQTYAPITQSKVNLSAQLAELPNAEVFETVRENLNNTLSRNDSTAVENVKVNLVDKKELRFHVIAGCFKEDENAENMVSYLKSKGFDAFVLDTVNGLKRVSAGASGNAVEAMKTLREIREGNISEAWLLTK